MGAVWFFFFPFNQHAAAAAAKLLQLCPTLCDPIDRSPPGSPIPGILQARTLKWVAISFSNAWKWKAKRKSLSCVRLLATPWTAAHQAPLSMGFPRLEYWSGVPLPSPPISIPFIYFSCLQGQVKLLVLCCMRVRAGLLPRSWSQGDSPPCLTFTVTIKSLHLNKCLCSSFQRDLYLHDSWFFFLISSPRSTSSLFFSQLFFA